MTRILIMWMSSLVFGSAVSLAQDPLQEPINHTVIAGETLERLATRYFGDPQRWREIHQFNPSIKDPSLLAIGLRIRVPFAKALPADSALLTQQANRVEERIAPRTWSGAENLDVLRQNDALRTFDEASAELMFPDNTSLVLTENSLVIVGLEEPKKRTTPSDLSVEVVLGQADVQRAAGQVRGRDIEIVVGGAAARPKPSSEGAVQTRARKPEAGGAQVMMYAGEGEVEAGGQKVHLVTGTGSVVAKGKAPGAPEILLSAPVALVPKPRSSSPSRRPVMRWKEVGDAAGYAVEVCGDPACAILIAKVTGVAAMSWQASKLPVGDLFWRVTAVSRSGLDGFPSPVVAFAVTDGPQDREGPTIALVLDGERLQTPRFGLHSMPIAGRGTALVAEITDPSGVAKWTSTLDGEPVTAEVLGGPWSSGLHTVVVTATDNVGNERVAVPFDFVYDPDPPVLRWGVQGATAHGQMAGLDGDVGAVAAPLLQGWRWWPDQGEGRRSRRDQLWRITSDRSQVRLWPQYGKSIHLENVPRAVSREQGLWVLAEDALCPGPPARLVYGLERQSSPTQRRKRSQGLRLIVEAEDCAGNISRMAWPLRDRRSARRE